MILDTLPMPRRGEHCAFMGNTGEGKTNLALALLQAQPHYIILNTKHDPRFFGERVKDDNKIFKIREGGYDYWPSDKFLQSEALQERFFAWCLAAGNRVLYIDEITDICPSARRYPWNLAKCMKRGRWHKLSMWVSSQEPVRAPSFMFGQAQNKYLFFLGWDPYRKMAEDWFQMPIPWEQIPQRSKMFFVQNTNGFFGPQPPIAYQYDKVVKQYARSS